MGVGQKGGMSMEENQAKAIGAALRESWEKGAAEEAVEHIDAAREALRGGGMALAYDSLRLADEASKLRTRYGFPKAKRQGFVIELCTNDALEQPKAQCDCISDFAEKTGLKEKVARIIVGRAIKTMARTMYQGSLCKVKVIAI